MTQSTPKISIIIPVFNTFPYLEKSIGSITEQSIKDIEIIVIDDGSTDSSRVLLKKMAAEDSRITLILQKNTGQSIARNNGLKKATGQYVYFMDSDDLLRSDALEECYNKCEKESLDMVIFDGKSFTEDYAVNKNLFNYQRLQNIENKTYSGIEILTLLLKNGSYSPSPCLYMARLSIIKDNQLTFYPHIIHEDNLFTTLVYLLCKKVGILPYTYFNRRIRANSIMTSHISRENIRGYLATSSELMKIGENASSPEKEAIDLYLSKTMTAVSYKARYLPLMKRIEYIFIVIKDYGKYVAPLNIAKVLFHKK